MVQWAQVPTGKLQTQPLRDALWSIYLLATFRNGLKTPALVRDQGLEPLSLREAVDTLVQLFATDQARLGRALRKVQAARLDELGRLVRFLGDEEGGATHNSIVALARALGIDIQRLAGMSDADALRQLVEWLHRLPPFVGECQIDNPACVACHDGLTLNTTVNAQVDVNLDPDDLVKIVDPRGWSCCNPYFLTTYRTEQEPDADGNWPVHPHNPLPLGDPWTGFLFEKVQGGPVIFENVLEVTAFTHSPREILLTYEEHRSWKTHFPSETINGGIEIDGGTTRVERIASGMSRVHISKTVRFADLTPGSSGHIDYGEILNYWAPAMLCLWVDDMTEVGPCCQLSRILQPHHEAI